ncbi:glycosyltransferase family 2 protein [Polynucleobacter sp. P1-05-14]|uniref:glycosyltransferase family 2 protein n=1 Tax=Polynucleobacter sp. P1-05-14 TaxID=1819732 RepID=UPI001C0AF944|nr:glycosyltransferase family 2 protein [Polynucleobacter sp. P1-05-14]MBU3547851.1 glycosyltransferase family 2 protein [Polynucleobacter sp. P1-05-14]
MDNIILSICIATYNRSQYIGATLDSIISQIDNRVEVIVVDGASPDNTSEIMGHYSRCPQIRYFRENKNHGVDRDYDKAVEYARGEYCWLFTDDDLLKPDAIQEVLLSLQTGCNLLVLNSEIRDAQLNKLLKNKSLEADDSVVVQISDSTFQKLAFHLTFIGYVVIKRDFWLARDRESYFDTAFIHVGVIFQKPPINNILFKSKPLLTIRYGNAMWTARGFQIWTFNWPSLIWSFNAFSDQAKAIVSPKKPYENIRMLMYQRALGAYKLKEYFRFLFCKSSFTSNMTGLMIAITPGAVINLITYLYFKKYKPNETLALYDLRRSTFHPSRLVKFLAKNELDQ